jgi:hypothetical protein
MTNVNKLVSDLITDLETIANEIVAGIKGGPESPTKEAPTAPEAPVNEPADADFSLEDDDDGFAALFLETGVSPAWEAVELLQKAESAADKGDNDAAGAYLGIADRYIKLADIFVETEITVTEDVTVVL